MRVLLRIVGRLSVPEVERDGLTPRYVVELFVRQLLFRSGYDLVLNLVRVLIHRSFLSFEV
jgi:hypothetical protein